MMCMAQGNRLSIFFFNFSLFISVLFHRAFYFLSANQKRESNSLTHFLHHHFSFFPSNDNILWTIYLKGRTAYTTDLKPDLPNKDKHGKNELVSDVITKIGSAMTMQVSRYGTTKENFPTEAKYTEIWSR